MNYESVFGYLATGISLSFYISLVIPFFKVLRCKLNYKYTPVALIITIYIDSITWYIYGELNIYAQLQLCSIIGFYCTFTLIVIYLALELREFLVDSILNALLLYLVSSIIHKSLSVLIGVSEKVGQICVCSKIITFFIPILMVYKVIKDRNYKLISIYTTLAYMASCIGWASFGKYTNDLYIILANIIGIFLCFIQFIVYFIFKRKYPKYNGATIGIERSISEESKKVEIIIMAINDESQEKVKGKPVKIINKIDK